MVDLPEAEQERLVKRLHSAEPTHPVNRAVDRVRQRDSIASAAAIFVLTQFVAFGIWIDVQGLVLQLVIGGAVGGMVGLLVHVAQATCWQYVVGSSLAWLLVTFAAGNGLAAISDGGQVAMATLAGGAVFQALAFVGLGSQRSIAVGG